MGYPHPTHSKEHPLLSKHFGDAGARTFDGWAKRGGFNHTMSCWSACARPWARTGYTLNTDPR